MPEKENSESIALQRIIVAIALECRNGIPSLLGKTEAPSEEDIAQALVRQYPNLTATDTNPYMEVYRSVGWKAISLACREFSRFPDTKRDWNVYKQYCLYNAIKGGYMCNGGYARIAAGNGMSPVRARLVVKRLPRQIAGLILSGLSLSEDFSDQGLAEEP